jgi:single-stranded DNA-binding protein
LIGFYAIFKMLNLTATGYVSGKPKIESSDYGDSCTISIRCKCAGGKHMSYVNAKFYGKRMDVIEKYIDDGDQVTVAGSVALMVEKTKKDGTKYSAVYVNGSDFTLPNRGQSNLMDSAKKGKPASSEEELPF